ncbi:MAG TPA: SBBP repeat-containing protein, partial [Pyrinomonadaceae bacterium]|nr:SBBP repeat-containing protein [Pyrinomonadaceae bacterium]
MSSPYKQTIAGKFLISLLLSIVIGATLAFLPGHSSTRRIEPAASIPPVLVEQPESLEAYSSLVSASPAVREPDQRTQVRAKEAYGNLPLSFEINQGQTDSQAKFMSRGAGYNLFLTANESVMVLSKPAARKASRGPNTAPEKEQTTRTAVVRMKLVDANQQARILGLEELPGKSNYFNGNDPKKWRSNVSNYAKVKYESVYPGVDMVYHGNQGELEYDFVISPGADTRVIRLGFEGARHLRIARNGDVVLTMREGKLRQQRPIAYQLFDGRRREVFSHYVMAGKDQIAIEVGAYDRSRELVIDPILAYSTFLGGSDAEFAKDLAVDAAGNAYVTGFTSSTNFPTRNPIQSSGGGFDAFVTKINPAGSATVYSTYVGGNDSDNGEAIKIDAFGSAYVTGITSSTNFPTFNAFQSTAGGSQDAFVLKLSATGDALVYATYLGGNFDDLGYDIAVDGAGSAYVTGSTESTNFPTLNPYDGSYNSPELEDAFITKLSPAGNALVYSTYLGGSLYDDGYGIAVDSLGNAYVTGYTQSANFPTAAALYPNQSFNSADAFVTKLNPTGAALVFSTFLGGPSPDYAKDIALDPSGNIYVTGQAGDGFPIVNAYQPMNGGDYDAFVTKMDPTATSIIYSTYLGGSVEDEGKSIAVDSSENVFITGFTLSTDFPKVRGLQGSYGGGPADM